MQHCDFGHPSADTRRLPDMSGTGGVFVCHHHYLQEAKFRLYEHNTVVPQWDSLAGYSDDAEEQERDFDALISDIRYRCNKLGFDHNLRFAVGLNIILDVANETGMLPLHVMLSFCKAVKVACNDNTDIHVVPMNNPIDPSMN